MEVGGSPPDSRSDAFWWSAASMDALLSLMATEDGALGESALYAPVCEAYAYVTGLSRTALVMQTVDGRDRVMASFGLPQDRLDELRPTPVEAPRLREEARRSPVFLLGPDTDPPIPRRYERSFGISTLACVPLFARRRPLGLMIGDGGGEAFDPSPEQWSTMWLAGKLVAVALIGRTMTMRQHRLQRLREWTAVGRRLHGRVVQPLTGVSMKLGLGRRLTVLEQQACERRLAGAVGDLRRYLEAPLRVDRDEETGDLRGKLHGRAAGPDEPPLRVSWAESVKIAPAFQPLVEHFIEEGMCNALKHSRPTKIEIRVSGAHDTLVEVINDGVLTRPDAKAGIGQRLMMAEALMNGCEAEFGPVGSRSWRAVLLLVSESPAKESLPHLGAPSPSPRDPLLRDP